MLRTAALDQINHCLEISSQNLSGVAFSICVRVTFHQLTTVPPQDLETQRHLARPVFSSVHVV